MTAIEVSIIIVNYNTKEYLRLCLRSIFDNTKDIYFEVIVSDNGSNDGSVEMIKTDFHDVVIIENKINLGFGSANNRALNIAKGKYILYLNSDTMLVNNAVKYFFDFFESYPQKNELGVLGCNLINEKNNFVHSYGSFPSIYERTIHYLRLNCTVFIKTILKILHISLNPRKNPVQKTLGEINGYITGADLFLLNSEDARFDEDFFLYYEEVDLQYKLSLKNKKMVLIEGPEIIHFDGASNKEREFFFVHFSFTTIQSYISSIIYFKKRGCNYKLLKILVILLLSNPFAPKNTRQYIKKILEL